MLFQHHVPILRALIQQEGKIRGPDLRNLLGLSLAGGFYSDLRALEDQGLIESELAPVSPVLQIRGIRLYWITDEGRKALVDLIDREYPLPTTTDAVFVACAWPTSIFAGVLCGFAIVHHEWVKAAVCVAVIAVLGLYHARIRRRFR